MNKGLYMDYSRLSDDDLLHMVSGLHDVHVNEEWYKRHGINLPYRLDKYGRILNCMSLHIVPDDTCDRLIAEQVNRHRTYKQLTSR